MTIPEDELAQIRRQLTHLIDERSSDDDDEMETDEQDLEDIQSLKTVLDVFRFLRDQGGRTCFVEWASCLDPLSRFVVDGKEDPDAEDETAFRDYLQRTYGINPREFPPAIDSEAE